MADRTLVVLFNFAGGGMVKILWKYLTLLAIFIGITLVAKGQDTDYQKQYVDTLRYWDSLSTQLIHAQKLDSGRAILLEAIPFALKRDQVDILPFLYFKLGYIREQKGQDPAVEYLEGLRIGEQNGSEEWLGMLYQKVAYVEKHRGNSSLAVKYAQKAVDFTTEREGRPRAASLVNLAWFLYEDNRPEKVCAEVLESGISYFAEDPASLQMIYHGFSEFYLFKVKDIHKALHYLDLMLDTDKGRHSSKALANKAKALGVLERWDEALCWHQTAMDAYFSDFEKRDDRSIPDFEGEKGFVQHWYPQQLAHLLLGRGSSCGSLLDLEGVIAAVDRSNEMLDEFRMKLNRGEKSVFSGYQRRNSELGVEACYELWEYGKDDLYLQKMLDYMERGRSTILLEKKIWENLFPDNERIALEQRMSQKMQELLLKIRRAPIVQRDALVSTTSEVNRELEKIKMEIEIESPLYFQGRYPSTISIEKLSSSLEKDQAILNFFSTESALFTLVITGDTAIAIRTDVSQVGSTIDALCAAIQSRSDAYLPWACQLHSTWIQPVLDLIDQRQWIVVKDYEQTVLPFEILLPCNESKNAPTDTPHMQYASSATLFFREDMEDPAKEMLALAPSSAFPQGLKDDNAPIKEELPGTIAEMQTVRSLFSGDFKTGMEATKEFFMDHAGEYRFIHLATHAVIDQKVPDASHLVFAADATENEHSRLEANELYTMKIPASLVTLSACNTGVGKMMPGEGAASLAKAFIYAGTENVLMSLWAVDDAVTAELMRYFYQFFHKSQNPSVALSQAKKEFVATHPGILKHPYYWSGFVVISSRWQQGSSGGTYLKWLVPGFCVLLLFGFLYQWVYLK